MLGLVLVESWSGIAEQCRAVGSVCNLQNVGLNPGFVSQSKVLYRIGSLHLGVQMSTNES